MPKAKCPLCKGIIETDVTRCRLCQGDLSGDELQQKLKKNVQTDGCAIGCLILVLIFLVPVLIGLGAKHDDAPKGKPETAKSPVAKLDPAEFKQVSEQGAMQYILVSHKLAKNPEKLRQRCREFYIENGSKEFFFLTVWEDSKKVAKHMPMTDAETDAVVAEYTINNHTGFRKFQYVRHGVDKEYDE